MDYVISFKDKITSHREFYAIDHASGGYPYSSSSVGQAKLFSDIEQAIEHINKDVNERYFSNMNSFHVSICEVTFKEIPIKEIEQVERQTAVNAYKSLSDEQKNQLVNYIKRPVICILMYLGY